MFSSFEPVPNKLIKTALGSAQVSDSITELWAAVSQSRDYLASTHYLEIITL